jgi:hypothetical protein
MKNLLRFPVMLILTIGVLCFGADNASAQATRTWISGVGDDVNPCSRTAPCKTFAGAISKTAANGEINCIDSGGFGSVTITKSITLDCDSVYAGVLVAATSGITINASASDVVVLRNLHIDGLGPIGGSLSGVNILSAATVHVENVEIFGFTNGILFQPTVNSVLTVNNVSSRNNSAHGIYASPSAGLVTKVSVANSRLKHNGSTGIRVDDGAASVSDTVLQGNGTHGVAAVTLGKIVLERVVTSGNVNAGILANGAGAIVWMSNITAVNNNFGLYPPLGGGQLISFGNNTAANNASGNGTPTSVANSF